MFESSSVMFALGAIAVLALQAFFSVARKIVGLKSEFEKSETLRAEAQSRLVRAEADLRLAELALASDGKVPTALPKSRVTVRPV